MGDQFGRDEVVQSQKNTSHVGSSPGDVFLNYMHSSGKDFAQSSDNNLSGLIQDDGIVGGTTRIAIVGAEGLAKAPLGLGKAIAHDLAMENWGETAFKAGTAYTLGLAMRTILPKAGAIKAIAGTVMGVSFVKDALTPLMEAGSTALKTRNMNDLHKAADKMGDSCGMFALDSTVGIYLGGKGEKTAGNILEKHFSGFEAAKSNMFNSTKSPVGRAIKSLAEPFSQKARDVESGLKQTRDVIQGKIDENNLARIREIKERQKNINEVEKLFREDAKGGVEKTATAGKSNKNATPELPVTGQDKYTYDPDNLAKAGKLREHTRDERSLEAEGFDHLQNEFIMPTEISINPEMTAKMSPAYRHSTDQIHALAKRITNEESFNEIRDYLEPHRVGRLQHTYGLSKTVDLNNYMIDSWKIKVRGLVNKAELPPEIIGKNLPPYGAVLPTNDGPYILPAIPRLLDCAVTVAEADARLYRDLVAYSHEGQHDWYNQFLRFDEKYRDTWMKDSARSAMKQLGIENGPAKYSDGTPILGANGKQLTTEEVLIEIAKAQSNENGCDWTSTAFSGHALPVQYGALEMSYDGKLGTESYKSPAFADKDNPGGFEFHDLGANRVNQMARVMQLRAPNHERTQNIANALINWANKFAPPGSDYRWEVLNYKNGKHSRTGNYVEMPVELWSNFMTNILKLQLFQPLERLQGKRWHDCLPDQATVTERIESLSDKLVEAVIKDQSKIEDFSKFRDEFNAKYPDEILGTMSMVDVANAGKIAETKAFAAGLAEKAVDERMERIHSWLREQFRDDHAEPLPVQPAPTIPVKDPAALRLAKSAIDGWNRVRRLPEAATNYNLASATGAINLDLLMREHELKKELEKEQLGN